MSRKYDFAYTARMGYGDMLAFDRFLRDLQEVHAGENTDIFVTSVLRKFDKFYTITIRSDVKGELKVIMNMLEQYSETLMSSYRR